MPPAAARRSAARGEEAEALLGILPLEADRSKTRCCRSGRLILIDPDADLDAVHHHVVGLREDGPRIALDQILVRPRPAP